MGRTVSFKNTLCILTSNVGSSVIAKGAGATVGFQLPSGEEGEGGEAAGQYRRLRGLVLEELKVQWVSVGWVRWGRDVVWKFQLGCPLYYPPPISPRPTDPPHPTCLHPTPPHPTPPHPTPPPSHTHTRTHTL